jgi:hypothetical protein
LVNVPAFHDRSPTVNWNGRIKWNHSALDC